MYYHLLSHEFVMWHEIKYKPNHILLFEQFLTPMLSALLRSTKRRLKQIQQHTAGKFPLVPLAHGYQRDQPFSQLHVPRSSVWQYIADQGVTYTMQRLPAIIDDQYTSLRCFLGN